MISHPLLAATAAVAVLMIALGYALNAGYLYSVGLALACGCFGYWLGHGDAETKRDEEDLIRRFRIALRRMKEQG